MCVALLLSKDELLSLLSVLCTQLTLFYLNCIHCSTNKYIIIIIIHNIVTQPAAAVAAKWPLIYLRADFLPVVSVLKCN